MKLSSFSYSIIISAYFVLIINYSFFKEISYDAVCFLFFLFFAFFYLTAFRFFTKFFALFFIITSSIVAYVIRNYNIDFNTGIVRSTLESTFAEIFSFFSLNFIIYAFFVLMLPCLLIVLIKISYPSFQNFILKKCFVFCLLLLVCISNDTNINKFTPFNYLLGFYNYFKENQSKTNSLQEFKQDKKIIFDSKLGKSLTQSDKKTMLIFVVGESARAESFSLNGYSRNTNPQLERRSVISFTNFYSCGTVTAISLPCMFSNFGRKNFDFEKFKRTENLIDIAKRANFNVMWIDNGMGSQGVAENIKKISVGSFYKADDDNALILHLPTKSELVQNNQNQFIILHQRGSHGPDYSERYRNEFRTFLPDCRNSILKSCSNEAVINSYDNTIVNTDHNLNEVINYLESVQDIYNTGLVYVSDHGESTGEDGLYLHGMTYDVAPENQTHVPFLVWFSKDFEKTENLDTKCLESMRHEKYSHDNIFHSLISLLDIETSAYNSELDLFGKCKF